MCCFSQPVLSVSKTNIFARAAPEGRQYLAYELNMNAAEDLAMILPLPVAPGSGEGAVAFLDLAEYPTFFSELADAFPEAQSFAVGPALLSQSRLAVVEVGSFEASFVPTIGDFDRLDARFRLPTGIWSQLPGYDRFGFAVFKLKGGDRRVHPMAFTFPSARPSVLFFPTLHVHDGQVHSDAEFDHSLFCQLRAPSNPHMGSLTSGWRQSQRPTSAYVSTSKSRGLVDPDDVCFRRKIEGRAPNRDIYLDD